MVERLVVIHPGAQKRVILKVYWDFRLLDHFRPKIFCEIGPWLEAKAE